MRLVVDANVLVGELFRLRGQARLKNQHLDLYIAEATWGEVLHELPRRQRAIARKTGASSELAETTLRNGLQIAQRAVTVVPSSFIEPFQDDARWRIPQDPDDWPSVALALAIDAGIWSEDRDFFGCGLATWTTHVLDHYLTLEEREG